MVSSTSDLLRLFDCTVEDLDANRAGRISAKQAKQLDAMMNRELFLTVIPIAGLLVICWFLANNLITSSSVQYDKTLVIMLYGMLPTVLAVGYCVFKKYRVYSDIRNGHIETIDGDVRIWSSRSFTYIAVAGKTLGYGVATNDDLRKYLQSTPKETLFRVYCVPKSKRVVSMEIITI